MKGEGESRGKNTKTPPPTEGITYKERAKRPGRNKRIRARWRMKEEKRRKGKGTERPQGGPG